MTTDDESVRRGALTVFAPIALGAVPLYLWLGRTQGFVLDEYDFLERGVNVHDLLTPHNEHWSTLPVIVYRALVAAFGTNHYWPYQLVVIGTHLAVALVGLTRRIPVSLATGALLFLFVAGAGRVGEEVFGVVLRPGSSKASRYVYVLAVLLLPAIAWGAETLRRRWPVMLPALVVLLAVGIPWNLADVQVVEIVFKRR